MGSFMKSLALLSAAIIALSTLSPIAAHAADTTVTGHVTSAGQTVGGITVGYLEPTTTRFASVVADAAGNYSLPVPSTTGPIVLWANLTAPYHTSMYDGQCRGLNGVFSDRVNQSYTGSFYGADGTHDVIYQTLSPFAAAPSSADLELVTPGSVTVRSSVEGAEANVTWGSVDSALLGGSSQPLSDGSRAFPSLIPGNYFVVFVYPSSSGSGKNRATSVTATFAVGEGESVVIDDAPLAGGTISGTVTYKGKPRAGVKVFGGRGYSVTDKKGRYTFSRLAAGTYPLRTEKKGNLLAVSASVDVKADGSRVTRNLKLSKSTTLTGTVSGYSSEHPLFAGSIAVKDAHGDFVASTPSGYESTVVVRTGVSSFRISGLPAGSYTVYVKNRAGTKYAVKKVTGRAAVSKDLGKLVSKKKTLTVKGWASGGEQEMTTVAYRSASVTPQNQGVFAQYNGRRYMGAATAKYSRAKGTYSFTGLLPGRYLFVQQLSQRQPEPRTVTLKTSRSVVFDGVAPLATVTGRVVVATPAGPVPADAAGAARSDYSSLWQWEDDGECSDMHDSFISDPTDGGSIHGKTYNGAVAVSVYASLFPQRTPVSYTSDLGTAKRATVNGVLDLGTVTLTIQR
jgi:hypothetical protein